MKVIVWNPYYFIAISTAPNLEDYWRTQRATCNHTTQRRVHIKYRFIRWTI